MAMKRISKISSISIKYKLTALCFSIATVLTVLFGTYAYLTSKNYVYDEVNQANTDKLRQVSTSIDYMRDDLYNVSSLLCINPDFQNYLRSEKKSSRQENGFSLNTGEETQDFIDYILAGKSYISLIIVYGPSGKPVYYQSADTSTGIRDLSGAKEQTIYQSAVSLQGKADWVKLDSGEAPFIEHNRFPKLAVCRVIKDMYTMQDLGFIVLCINQQSVTSLFSGNLSEGENISIYDGSRKLLIGTGTGEAPAAEADIFRQVTGGNGCFQQKVGGRSAFVSFAKSSNNDWTYFYTVPVSHFSGRINWNTRAALIIILAGLALAFPLTLLVSVYLTRPLKTLLESMDRFQKGHFDEWVEVHSADEIGKLQKGYNGMVSNIRHLINDVYVLQLREREAELQALQAEINPHFLYNTLDMLYWKAEKQGATEIGEIVYSLSRLFRLSLNQGMAFTTVHNEEAFIENYLILQKSRFTGKLEYSVDIDPWIYEEKIPKLILQPFVENAIIHGIEPGKRNGVLRVSGKAEGGGLHFCIEDDGVGMDAAALEKLLAFSPHVKQPANGKRHGYAVKNVLERLKIYFDGKARVEIQSRPGEGTRVDIYLPFGGKKTSEGKRSEDDEAIGG